MAELAILLSCLVTASGSRGLKAILVPWAVTPSRRKCLKRFLHLLTFPTNPASGPLAVRLEAMRGRHYLVQLLPDVRKGGVFGIASHLLAPSQRTLSLHSTSSPYGELKAYTGRKVPCGPRGLSATVRESQMLTRLHPVSSVWHRGRKWTLGAEVVLGGLWRQQLFVALPFPTLQRTQSGPSEEGASLTPIKSLCLLRVEITSAMVKKKRTAKHNQKAIKHMHTHTGINGMGTTTTTYTHSLALT